MSLLLRGAETGAGPADCRVHDGRVHALAPELAPRRGERVIDARGGALLPGLTDHHIHLLATAAAMDSVRLTPGADLATAVRAAPAPHGWVRVLGYDEIRHGDLDRDVLDALEPARPVRVQHRGGSLWVLNSAALRRLGLDAGPLPPGVELDGGGRPTGRLWRADAVLRERLPLPPPDLSRLGAVLAAYGITSVTDATPDLDEQGVAHITAAMARGDLPQRVTFLGAAAPPPQARRAALGPRKIVVPDHTLPSPDDLAAAIRAARAARRAVALHCVTREALALIIAALTETGTVPGDRLEHCAVASPDALEFLARHDLRVITQPSLPAARGDDYLARVDPEDLPDLWRYAGFLRAGVRVAPSSDAPYGGLDPWAAMAAARDRATPSGLVLGPAERVPARTVLDGALSHPLDPGGPPARLAVGAPADLVLLRVPLARALREPDSSLVALTVIEGRIAYEAAP